LRCSRLLADDIVRKAHMRSEETILALAIYLESDHISGGALCRFDRIRA
jgi:hypothetical protein